jgi:hypothetical protein
MKNNEYLKLIGYVLLTFVVVWILALISNKCFDVEINSDTAIISFIGIIATFVVIGNYSQVAEMRNQALEQTKNYNLKIEEFDSKLKEIDTLKESINTKEKDIEYLQNEFYQGQIMIFVLLSTEFFNKKEYNTAFILTMTIFRLSTIIPFRAAYNTFISKLKESLKETDKDIYTQEQSREILTLIDEAKDISGFDQKILDELKEEVKKKNIELGYS